MKRNENGRWVMSRMNIAYSLLALIWSKIFERLEVMSPITSELPSVLSLCNLSSSQHILCIKFMYLGTYSFFLFLVWHSSHYYIALTLKPTHLDRAQLHWVCSLPTHDHCLMSSEATYFASVFCVWRVKKDVLGHRERDYAHICPTWIGSIIMHYVHT